VSRPVDPDDHPGPDPMELAWSAAPPRGQLLAWAELGEARALAEFAEVLGRRRDGLWARAEELAARERQLGLDSSSTVVPDSVALAGVAACIRSLVVETGDDVATVAAALDIDPQWARGVLTGEVTEVDPEQMQRMASALESAPEELFVVTDLSASSRAMLAAPRAPVPDSPVPTAIPAVHHLVDAAGAVLPSELSDCVAALAREERFQLVDALDQRHRALCRWSAELARHEDRLARTPPEPNPYEELSRGAEVQLSAAPAAEQIALLVAETGDDLHTVARGLGLDEAWVRGVLSGNIEWVNPGEAHQLCAALELELDEVFGPGASALVTPAAPCPVTPSPQDSDTVGRIKAVAGALADEVAIEAAERGLDGRQRETWVERRLDELIDLSAPLPADHSPAVAVAATYRQMVRSEIGVDLDEMVLDGRHLGEPVDPPEAPGLELGP
jgi:hypothetical protein